MRLVLLSLVQASWVLALLTQNTHDLMVTQQHNRGQQVYRSSQQTADSIVDILTVARTAEQLAVTFYTNGVANADKLGITGDNLAYLKAALVEEQIHQQFLVLLMVVTRLLIPSAFPQGPQTFTDLKTFIATQQQLEGVFDSAFLAAIMEFAQLGRPDLAQIAGQIATVESEHRALGRANRWSCASRQLGFHACVGHISWRSTCA